MTPAIDHVRSAGVAHSVHEYDSDGRGSYGREAAIRLGLAPERVFKTLIARIEGSGFVSAIVPVSSELDLKRLAAAAKAKRASMADPRDAERATGYLLGGISPLGQRRRLPAFVDVSAADHPTVFVSGGRRGLELELAPRDLVTLCGGRCARIARSHGASR
jgi:Cys-tRNA(Pro)/Cys-tRNA(Cys) deacylase